MSASTGKTLPVWGVRKTADQTFASATPADVTGMSFSVRSGGYYHFRFVILYQSDTSTVGLQATVTTPAFTRFGARLNAIVTGDGAGRDYVGAITASGDAVLTTNVPAINEDYVAVVEGVIIPSANGTLQLQAATETGTTNVIVRQGSVGFLTQIRR